MWRYLAIVCVILAVVPLASAANATQPVMNDRLIAAEVAKQIKQSEQEMLGSLKAYQDENFGILDARIIKAIQDMRMQVILAVIGASFMAGAVVTLIIVRASQRYSYEKYLEQTQVVPEKEKGVDFAEMQQRAWNVQQNHTSVSSQFGQSRAGDMSVMNQWQQRPAYAGAWMPPKQQQRGEL